VSVLAPAGDLVADDGRRLALHRLAGPRGAPPLVWGHANGFCTGSYTALLADLARDHDVWAWDARGHGASAEPTDAATLPNLPLARFADDAAEVCAFVARETGRPPIAAGHSFGALALVHAARDRTPWIAGCFFEPPIADTATLADDAAAAGLRARIEATLRRRRTWPSPEDFADRLARDAAHAGIARTSLLAHAHAALRPNGGTWALRCAPEVEAAIYRLTFTATASAALRPLDAPALFVRSDREPARWPALALIRATGRVGGGIVALPDTTHLMPLERPDLCAATVRALTVGAPKPPVPESRLRQDRFPSNPHLFETPDARN
jgi:pimeloyl-ACP methyl ester carboxylesterase